MTLIELTIALAVAGLLMSMSVVAISALSDADLRSSAVQLTGSIKFSYDRAIMQNRIQRIGMNIDEGTWWLEYTQDPFALREERDEGTMGATIDEDGKLVYVGEEEIRSRLRFDRDTDPQVKMALEGGLGAAFTREEDMQERRLPGSVRFARVWTGHQEEPIDEGIAFLHFFDGGWTEPAMIELRDEDDDIVTLRVAPLTGRVRTYPHALDAPELEEHDGHEDGDL